jgi:hypothetical protein
MFTAASDDEASVARIAQKCGLKMTRIGAVRKEPGIMLAGPDGEPVSAPAMLFEHFVPEPGKEK